MIIDIPDHYAANVGGALVERAVDIINRLEMVPGYLYQFEDMWDKGLHYGGKDLSFWQAVYDAGAKYKVLDYAGVRFSR